MKFLCEHCKAKYQIADEKVVGRTVRMKCRKCGGSIEVRAAVTETSVSVKAGDVAAEGKPKPPTGRPPPPRAAPLATSLSSSARTAAPARSGAESPLAGAFQRNVQRSRESEDEATSAGFDVRELSAADEWYVAVNGVPVGPVRVGEVRRKAAMGAVTEDSLCWQEGMEEWRPVRTVTELAAVVREAASGGRASQLPGEPRTGGAPPRPGAARSTGQHAAMSTSTREPSKAPLAPAWASRASTAGMEAHRPMDGLEEDAAPTIVGRSPLLEMEAAAAAAGAHANGTPRPPAADPFRPATAPQDPFRSASTDPLKAVDPFAIGSASPGSAAATGSVAAVQAVSPLAPPQPIVVAAPRGLSPIGIGVIVMFACFGMTAAYFILGKKERPVVVVAPPAPSAAAAPAPTDLPAVTPGPTATTPTAAAAGVEAGVKVASSTPRATGGAVERPSKVTGNTATDPALRDLIASTGNGPAAGPGGGGGGGGGAQMNEDDIKSVVSQHNLGVRRTCWDRSASTTSSVNVTVHIVIAGSGQVTQANATGNDPVVGHCLEEEIRRWRWPGGGEVNVPFHFLRQ